MDGWPAGVIFEEEASISHAHAGLLTPDSL